jgi:hypothetical protein
MNPSPPPLNPSDASGVNRRRDHAWGVAIANQLALPGFGTVMAGRKIGYAQLALSVSGVLCFTAFLIYALPQLGELLRQLTNPTDDPDAALEFLARWVPWLGVAFAGIFLWMAAWFWALGTSVKAVRGGSKAESR